ncbi:MAG: replication initiation and membrane attachment family protein [Vulcanibacillus sp.]
MENVFSEITPQDSYIVVVSNSIVFPYISNFIDLYQPIIGLEATSFYLTLHNHITMGEVGYSKICLHRQLMSKMSLSFPVIMRARKTLEAIGLVKSKKFKHIENNEYIYEYNLLQPLSAKEFFQSDILSLLLINRIGKTSYQQLRERLLKKVDWDKEKYIIVEEITKSFDEVFDSILTSEIEVPAGSEVEELLQKCDYKDEQGSNIVMKKKYLDMEFIKGMVSNLYQLDKILDKKLVTLLQELAFLYQLSEMEIINLLNDHTIYNESGRIETEQLRTRARGKYQISNKEIQLVNKYDSAKKDKEEQPSIENKAQRHKWILENYSPIDLIQQYQGGGKVSDSDSKIIDSLLYDFKLSSGVTNVLIEYVMLSNDYKLPKNFIEKIAGHWKRLKIATVEEALGVAKKEHQLYKEWTTPISSKNTSEQFKSRATAKVKKEKVPDYILNQEDKYHKNTNGNENNEVDSSKMANINRLLKNLGEK